MVSHVRQIEPDSGLPNQNRLILLSLDCVGIVDDYSAAGLARLAVERPRIDLGRAYVAFPSFEARGLEWLIVIDQTTSAVSLLSLCLNV